MFGDDRCFFSLFLPQFVSKIKGLSDLRGSQFSIIQRLCLKHFAINSPCLTIAIYIFFHFSRLFEKLGCPLINIFSAPTSFKSVFRRFSVALYSLLFAL